MRNVLYDAYSLLKLRIGLAIAGSALAGVASAQGAPIVYWKVGGLLLAVFGAAGAASAFNHYYERDLDRRMARTRSRPFASGRFTPTIFWPFAFLGLLAASLALAYAVAGWPSAIFVFLGAFTYGIVYTVWLKRRSALNIVVGGLAGSFALLAGAAAVGQSLQPVPALLATVLFLWTPPHFWSLAAARREEYGAAGVPMLPVTASQRTWTLAILLHTVALAALSLVPLGFGLGPIYGLCAAVGGTYFVYCSYMLHHAPSKSAAMRNFAASLLQLNLLILGILLDRLSAGIRWPG